MGTLVDGDSIPSPYLLEAANIVSTGYLGGGGGEGEDCILLSSQWSDNVKCYDSILRTLFCINFRTIHFHLVGMLFISNDK